MATTEVDDYVAACRNPKLDSVIEQFRTLAAGLLRAD